MFSTNQNTRSKKDHCRDNFNQKFDRCRDKFFSSNHPFKEAVAEKLSAHKPVNISENEDYFALQLFAAGLKKEAFNVSIKNNVLKIAYNETQTSEPQNIVYQEYYPTSFERSFQLTSKVKSEVVSASYEDGILTIILPKDPEHNLPAQKIDIH
ncbi:HSP20 family protein [Soonwooa buanensis]|uniref:HSP20 family protein n=1 Tax=Soonwooa buanensis TaxID=619805 RepID=A0A1T5EGR0_9FLAO|nr:Hsp20/alpha crystallin family protein [Soonwooa buanensis]SKB83069.1 HSP20 family protein [Soonwooa buanensis]